MIKKILHNIRHKFERKAIVLMYHRIASPMSDVWEISVSPERFEAHLQVLKKMGNVIPLQQLADELKNGALKKDHIAITFDDGYVDNFEVAIPLLEKYELPATFFISSGNIGTDKEFWWDELEQLFLFSPQLPPRFSQVIQEKLIEMELISEVILNEAIKLQHCVWKACTEPPPTQRALLFYRIWEQLKPLPSEEQQVYLQKIRNWAKVPLSPRNAYKSMSVDALNKIAAVDLFTIGAHTVTHPALAFQTTPFQKKEIFDNIIFLENTIGKSINFLAYPYGNYHSPTIEIAASAGLQAAFTTQEEIVQSKSERFSLGRFQVKNISGELLHKQILNWKT